MLWIETRTDAEARELQRRMWQIETRAADGVLDFHVRGEGLYEGGRFWADAIAGLKDAPDERLRLAMRQLPLPVAFREAAVALRVLIRVSRKSGSDSEPLLRALHGLAAIWSFYIPYAPRVGLPGYNVIALIPFSAFTSMDLSWPVLGYEKLDLLTKTDRRWMVECWGEPAMHTTAHEKYRAVWDTYETMLVSENR